MLISLVLFILAAQLNSDTTQCRVWAVGLHYFWLAAFCWMVVEGVNLHAVCVIVIGLEMEKRMRYYYACAYGKKGGGYII